MSAEVESMFSARKIPWHGLGKVTEETLTGAEALVAADLDWQVEMAPVYAKIDGKYRVIEQQAVPYRKKDGEVDIYDARSKDFTPVQNHEQFDFIEALLDTGEVRYETAGSLRNGRVVFACARLERELVIDSDAHVPYLVTSNGHDGHMAFRAMATPVRVVCMNTLRAAWSNAKSKWYIRHTKGATQRVAEAKEVLGLTYKYYDAFEVEATKLLNQAITDRQFENIVQKVFPVKTDDTDRKVDIQTGKQLVVTQLWEKSDTIKPIRNTAWGVVNTFNEWELWRQGRGEPDLNKHLERQAMQIMHDRMPATEQALALVRSKK